MYRQMAFSDFRQAQRRALWRRIRSWFTGEELELLPFDQVRSDLPFGGQRDLGVRSIPIENIVGSVSRYKDFDRAFLPTQEITSERWVNIGTLRYADVELPPIEAYKIGDVYFVKDGNHRVSVARERGQLEIDAYVAEIDVPVPLKPTLDRAELRSLKDYAAFLTETELGKNRPVINSPDHALNLSQPRHYNRLAEHIRSHAWFLGEDRDAYVSIPEAATSWYDNVYLPLVEVIKQQGLTTSFPEFTLTDLYLYVSEYRWLRREERAGHPAAATERLAEIYAQAPVARIIRRLNTATWIDHLILAEERESFLAQTKLAENRPASDIRLTLAGKYGKLLEHISVHRYYLGQRQNGPVSLPQAAASWYDHVYLPKIQVLRELGTLADFPHRTEADLYLWVMDHQTATADLVREGATD
ncbi:MAG: hypothetical protein H6651_05945 [Ardenticatenales bacterium]|nr:hypothetical protein [Ardenticatenales bacterium]